MRKIIDLEEAKERFFPCIEKLKKGHAYIFKPPVLASFFPKENWRGEIAGRVEFGGGIYIRYDKEKRRILFSGVPFYLRDALEIGTRVFFLRPEDRTMIIRLSKK